MESMGLNILSLSESVHPIFTKLVTSMKKRWAEKIEAEVRKNKKKFGNETPTKTLQDAIERYRKTVLFRVKRSRREPIIDWWEQLWGKRHLFEISPRHISEIRDQLLTGDLDGKKRAPATVVKYLATLSHILSICTKEWEWLDSNPVLKVSKPPLPRGRDRFLQDHEREPFLQACRESSNPFLYPIVILAIALGMRRSEITTLTWTNCVDLERNRIILRQTKNNEIRVLPGTGFNNCFINLVRWGAFVPIRPNKSKKLLGSTVRSHTLL